MLLSFSRHIINWLIRTETINEQDQEIYLYGMRLFFVLFINIVTGIIIGCIFEMLIECFIFFLLFIPLRMNAGGIHASNYLKCYLLSSITIIVILYFIKTLNFNSEHSIWLIIISTTILNFLAPIEDTNKPLDDNEIIVYGLRTRKILIIYLILAFILSISKLNTLLFIESLSQTTIALILLSGMIKNKVLQLKN